MGNGSLHDWRRRAEVIAEWQSAVEQTVLAKSRTIREHNRLNSLVDGRRLDVDKYTKMLATADNKKKELAEKALDQSEKLKETSIELPAWRRWWAWVSAKASPSLSSLWKRLGSHPPRSLGDLGLGDG